MKRTLTPTPQKAAAARAAAGMKPLPHLPFGADKAGTSSGARSGGKGPPLLAAPRGKTAVLRTTKENSTTPVGVCCAFFSGCFAALRKILAHAAGS